ncbi:MAG: hypothetical protein GY749_13270 [Desulfobacteraceae bacterium]|nr:hypothetical protein [Desulfobacteraceae bacterium]
MKKLIEFELEDGSTIFIETEDSDKRYGEQMVGKSGKASAEKAEKRFKDAIEHVKSASDTLLESFREMNTPDEIGLEFGMKFNAKAGAIFASVDSEATFKVSLKWTNEKTGK